MRVHPDDNAAREATDAGGAVHRGADDRGPAGPITEVSEQTFFRWKARYGGLEVSELQRLRQLEEEHSRLKRLVADLTLDNQGAQAARPRKV